MSTIFSKNKRKIKRLFAEAYLNIPQTPALVNQICLNQPKNGAEATPILFLKTQPPYSLLSDRIRGEIGEGTESSNQCQTLSHTEESHLYWMHYHSIDKP